MTCPAPELLISIATGDANPDRAVAKHVLSCDKCRAEVDALRETTVAVAGLGAVERYSPTPECLDEIDVADFLDGLLDEDKRERLERHLSNCARCRSLVRATSAIVADESIRREMPRAGGRGRWLPAALGVAAAAAIVIAVVPLRNVELEPTLREAAVTSAIAPVTLVPTGSVQRVERLVWSRVPGVERYRVRIQSSDGAIVWSATTEDSSLALPDSIQLAAATYFWRVEAQTEWRRWVASDLTQFVVERAR